MASTASACFETPGVDCFTPFAGANPTIGAIGTAERVDETRVELICVGRPTAVAAVAALKKAHPYEEPAYDVVKLEEGF